MIALALSYLRTQAIESGVRLTQSFAQVIEEQTSSTIQTVDQRLQLATSGLAQLDTSGGLNEQSARVLLRQQVKELPFVRAIWVLDAQGRIQYDSDVGNIGVSLADRPYFQIYRAQPQTGFYLGSPVRSRSTGTWLISAARPLRSANGNFAGIIVAAMEPPYFDKLWRMIDLGAGGSIALFRNDGTLMMRSPLDDGAMAKVFSNTRLFSELLPANSAGNYQSNSAIDGTLRAYAYRTLQAQPGLLVVVGQSFELLLAPWRNLAILALAIWVAASAAVILLCVFLNRTWQQRLRAEANAELLAQRLTLATDAASIGVWDWDLIADRWYATPTYFTMLGYKPEADFGSREQWLERLHPLDRAAVAAKIEAAFAATDVPYKYEARMRHADGSYRWVSVIGRVLERDVNAKVIRLLGVRMDITESKQAQATLRDSEQRFKLAASTGNVWDWNLLSNQVSFPQEFWRALGYDERDIGNPTTMFESILHPQDRARWQQATKDHISQRLPYDFDYRARTKSGEYRWFNTKGQARWDENGRATYMAGTTFDITERKQAEQSNHEQLDELLRWQALMIGREERMLQLKGEVNELLARQGESGRYAGLADS